MSKATRIRQQNAREKIKAQQAAARRAETRRRVLIVAGSVVAVLAIVVAFVLIKVNNNNATSSGTASGGVTGTALPASVQKDLTTVPASTLDTVGIGSATPSAFKAISNTPLTSNGKPEMLYIGAEYCPYCAAERWAIGVALSRFGTFTTQLRGIHSSSTDVYPHTPTITYYKAGYTSPYLVFTPVENEDLTGGPLQATTAEQGALWKQYDTTSSGSTGYPFIDFGNKVVLTNPSYSPQVLAGMTWAQVAAALHNPNSAVAQGVLGSANLITASICKMTGGKPGDVCTSAGVVSASAHL
jgi:hypothetical protein